MAYTLRDDQFWPTGGVVAGHSSWRSDRAEAGGGALLEHSIHSCDILGWLFGPVERVYATTRSVFGYSVEDVAALTIEHRNGVVGNLVTVFNGVQHREERRLEVFFERASVELTTDFLVGAPEDSFLVHRADEQHAQRVRRGRAAARGIRRRRLRSRPAGVRVPVLRASRVRERAARRPRPEPRRRRRAPRPRARGGRVPQRSRARGRWISPSSRSVTATTARSDAVSESPASRALVVGAVRARRRAAVRHSARARRAVSTAAIPPPKGLPAFYSVPQPLPTTIGKLVKSQKIAAPGCRRNDLPRHVRVGERAQHAGRRSPV